MCHHGSATEFLTDIRAKRPDIGAAATGDRQSDIGNADLIDHDPVDPYRHSCAFHALSLACQLIQPFSLHMPGAVHRRNLIITPHKAVDHLTHLPLCQSIKHCGIRPAHNSPCLIQRIRLLTKPHLCTVCLYLTGEQVSNTRCLSHADRQYALSCRIQCTGMADLFDMADAAYFCHNIKGGPMGLLVDI